MVLDHFGYQCTCAASGEAALELFSPELFDALLIDKNLPGIDGIELIRRVQERDHYCESVLITAYANIESVVAAIDLGAADYLRKPIDSIDVLPAVLNRAIRRRNRRLLARRILTDLRTEVKEQIEKTTPMLMASHERVNAFNSRLEHLRRLLVWDQEVPEIRRALERLKAAGYTISTFASGAEGTGRCKRGGIDVVLVSDRLGDMTGLQFVDRLIELDNPPELVFVTAVSSLKNALAAVSRGASGYFVKPIRDSKIVLLRVEAARDNFHDRMRQHKMVKELSAIVGSLNQDDDSTQRRITDSLSEFDVGTAELALEPYEGPLEPIEE